MKRCWRAKKAGSAIFCSASAATATSTWRHTRIISAENCRIMSTPGGMWRGLWRGIKAAQDWKTGREARQARRAGCFHLSYARRNASFGCLCVWIFTEIVPIGRAWFIWMRSREGNQEISPVPPWSLIYIDLGGIPLFAKSARSLTFSTQNMLHPTEPGARLVMVGLVPC